MCGFVGKYSYTRIEHGITGSNIEDALFAITHRGPDDHGFYADDHAHFGHARLSITDLTSRSRQPMFSRCGNFLIIFNGEIYNYKELKEHRALDAVTFSSTSDTEVLLELFVKLGVDCFTMLNGVFAFSIYDIKHKKAYLVRDRFGVKPLFYKHDDSCVYFSSEIKGILNISNPAVINISNLNEWAYYGCNFQGRTLFRDIKHVNPGEYITIDISKPAVHKHSFWKISSYTQHVKKYRIGKIEGVIGKSRDLLEKAVARQLPDEVPFAISLSGGLDSSAIAAIAAMNSQKPFNTYTIRFDGCNDHTDIKNSRIIAKQFNLDHTEIDAKGIDLVECIQDLVHYHDYPFSDAANIPLYFLGKQIKNSTKVILQGDGGDELFAGYRRYSTLKHSYTWKYIIPAIKYLNLIFPKRDKHYFRRRRYINALNSSSESNLMALLLTVEDADFPPTNIFSTKIRGQLAENSPFSSFRYYDELLASLDLVQRMLYIDTVQILPSVFLEKVDRAFMASGIEARVPFLDNELVDFILPLPSSLKVRGSQKKWLLKKAMEPILPKEVIYSKKSGFGVPYGLWLKGPLVDFFKDQLFTCKAGNNNILDFKFVNFLFEQHRSGAKDNSFLLWKVLNLVIWVNKYNFGDD